MTTLRKRMLDWWRGYTTADLRSLLRKLEAPRKPGSVIPLSTGEFKALCKYASADELRAVLQR